MLIDLLTYVCLDKTALISALGFIKKTVMIKVIASFCSSFGYYMACRGSGVQIPLAPFITNILNLIILGLTKPYSNKYIWLLLFKDHFKILNFYI